MCDPTGGIATTAILALGSTAANYAASQQQKSAMNSAQQSADQRMAGLITRDSMANFNAAQQAAARNQAYMDSENARQDQYRQQTQGLQDASIQRNSSQKMNELLAQEEEAGRQRYAGVANGVDQSAVPTSSAGGESGENSTRVVNDSIKKSLGTASNYLRGLGNARAGMEAFQNTMLGQNIALNQANQQIGKIGTMAAGSRDAYGQEINSSNSIQQLLQQQNALQTGYDKMLADVAAQDGYTNAQNAGQGLQTLGTLLGTGSQLSGMGMSAGGFGAGGTFGKGTFLTPELAAKAAPGATMSRIGVGQYVPRATAVIR